MLCAQIALSGTEDLDAVVEFYVEGLGFLPSGGMSIGGVDLARLMGLDVDAMQVEMKWVVDRTEFFQLELFNFSVPECRPRRADWSPADVGYNVFTVHIREFDETIRRLATKGVIPMSEIVGSVGDRRACVADPNGNLVELVEKDPAPDVEAVRPEVNAAVRGIRVTVPDIESALLFFKDILQVSVAASPAHNKSHECLWGLSGQEPELVTLTDGRMFVELANYGKSTRGWPAGYRFSDQGVLNIAFGNSTDKQDYLDTRRRVELSPHTAHPEASLGSDLQGTYVMSDEGFSVETFYWGKPAWAQFGLLPT